MSKLPIQTADPNDLAVMWPTARQLPDGTRPLLAMEELPVTRTYDGNRAVAYVVMGAAGAIRVSLLLEGERGENGEDLTYEAPADLHTAWALTALMRATAAEVEAGRMPPGFVRVVPSYEIGRS